MKKRCEWITKAMKTDKVKELMRNPKFAQIQAMCKDLLAQEEEAGTYSSHEEQDRATVEKEAIESKCAWLHKVKESGELEKIRAQPWYNEVEALCSGVPLAEMEDNAVEILKQKCVWFEMARMTDKLRGQEGEQWYQELSEKCMPVAGEAKEKAQQVAGKLQGAYSVAKKLFGRVAGQLQDAREDRGSSEGGDYNDDYDEDSDYYMEDDSEIQ